MKFLIYIFYGIFSFQAYGQDSFKLNFNDIIFVSRVYELGDNLGGQSTLSRLTLYRDGTVDYLTNYLEENGVYPTTILVEKAKQLFLKSEASFQEFTIGRNIGRFPCLGSSTVRSAGMPVTNYLVGLKHSRYGRDMDDRQGEVIKLVSFPSICLSIEKIDELEKIFELVGDLI